MGTAFSQMAWLPVLRALGTRPFFGNRLYVAGTAKVFDTQGQLIDESTRERLRTYLANFVTFCK